MKEKSRSTFSGNIGFVLAAAGSAVGLGNIWRFPYLAAKDGGGLFLLVYLILVLTFGFTLLTTEIAIGRKTGQGPLTAYGLINTKGKFIGVLACIVPAIILPYYCTIGGWVLKYFTLFITGSGKNAVADGYFTGFITGQWAPIIFGMIIRPARNATSVSNISIWLIEPMSFDSFLTYEPYATMIPIATLIE